MVRLIDDETLDAEVRKMLRSNERAWAFTRFMQWAREQPQGECTSGVEGVPRLVGSTAAARILGIPPPHVARLRKRGRLPVAIPVDGGYDVYTRDAIEALAAELAVERRAREVRRAERVATEA